MPGIMPAIQHYFSPKISADTVIRQASANGLTNEIAVGPQSSSAKVTIGVMSALTGVITLPVFMKLYDAFQQFFTAPEKLKMLALLGCRTPHARIEQNIFGPDTRSITIPLRGKNDPYTTIHFIERKKTVGSRETELFVKDYRGEEKPCFEQFSTLEEVKNFYQADLAEDKDEIYSQNLSKKQFLFSTLGAALYHYGSDQFNEYDLLHFERFFGVMPGTIKLEDLQNPALLLNHNRDNYDFKNDVDFFLSMIAQRPSLNEWDRNSTDYLLQMVFHGLSDGMLSIYQHIFTEKALGKYTVLANEIFSLCHQYSTEHALIHSLSEEKKFDSFMDAAVYLQSLTPTNSNFTREFSLSNDTKVTLQNHSLHDRLVRNGVYECPRLELTIADKTQSVMIHTIDNALTRELILREQATHSKNYATFYET